MRFFSLAFLLSLGLSVLPACAPLQPLPGQSGSMGSDKPSDLSPIGKTNLPGNTVGNVFEGL